MNLAKAGIEVGIKMEMKREGTAPNLAHFPDRGMLEKYGVKGITSYSYPKNAVELNQRVVAKIGAGVNIFGDF